MAISVRKLAQDSERIKTLLDDVSAGSAEQTAGFRQITDSALRMQQAGQNVLTAAEETAAAADQVNAQGVSLHLTAERLAVLVGTERV